MPTPDHYCTLSDVNGLAVQVPFTASSRPTATAVTAFIEAVAKRMDATLGNLGYVVPVVTGDEALALLREACSWGALGMAEQVRGTGTPTIVSDASRPVLNIWLQQFEAWMKRLISKTDPFRLPDAPLSDVAAEKNGANALRSFVQSVDDGTYNGGAPVVSRYQVL